MGNITRILVTGSRGFIGKNLILRLCELKEYEVIEFASSDPIEMLPRLILEANAIVHLAGVNRPQDAEDFNAVNRNLTQTICDAIKDSGKIVPFILASSTQAVQNNLYGQSKRAAERAVEQLAIETGNPTVIYRLPGVFGKWCRPNYNSVVATFCNNIANDLPIQINDPTTCIRLTYIDDVVNEFISAMRSMKAGVRWGRVEPEYSTTLEELSNQIYAFKNCRTSLVSERVGKDFTRALYATYVSYLPTEKFLYDLPYYGDERGVFVEMLKTPDTGQFSYFTAHPGITRGGHYHHSKTEKFLVIKGIAKFKFRHILTNETFELATSGDKPQIVETVPGWTHDITNIGESEMVVMLWANEIFDRDHPDTITCKV